MTLKRYVRKTTQNPNTVYRPNYVTKQIFSTDEEKLLCNFLVRAAKLHYGLSAKTTRKLAFDYAVANKKDVPQSWNNNGCAGKDWLRDFLKRSGSLSLRMPEATSLSRSTAWNKQTKYEFFSNLHDVRSRHDYMPHNIYNVDETALTTVQKPVRVVAAKGSKQVGRMTSAERGALVTACCCVNAIGNAIPPFFVYPRVHFKSNMIIGGPPGCVGTANPSGWMSADCFLQWMAHFVKFSQCSVTNKVLLLLDNHDSHISFECLELAKRCGITMLTFPPHTTHKLQPLDVAVYGPLKQYYNASCDQWMMSNPRPMTIFDIASVASPAFVKSFSASNIIAGFKKTGIEPFNPAMFDCDDEFLGASVTDRPPPCSDDLTSPGVSEPMASSSASAISVCVGVNVYSKTGEPSGAGGSSSLPDNTHVSATVTSVTRTGVRVDADSNNSECCVAAGSSAVHDAVLVSGTPSSCGLNLSITSPSSLEELMQFPKAGPRKAGKGRQRQKSRILTDTPVCEEVRKAKEQKKMNRREADAKDHDRLKARKRLHMADSTGETTNDIRKIKSSTESKGQKMSACAKKLKNSTKRQKCGPHTTQSTWPVSRPDFVLPRKPAWHESYVKSRDELNSAASEAQSSHLSARKFYGAVCRPKSDDNKLARNIKKPTRYAD